MEYTCPVCGYDKLEDPPTDDEICPSCGTQFGYHDFNSSHSQLRERWFSRNMKWHSKVDAPPLNWNPFLQLRKAGLISKTETTVKSINPTQTRLKVVGVVKYNERNWQVVTPNLSIISSLFSLHNDKNPALSH